MRKAVWLAVVLGFLLGMSIIGEAKSMYVIANHHTAQFDAWNIEAPGSAPPITYQATYNLSHANDPAGVTVDSDSAVLFITSEFNEGVELVDATTMTSLGWAPGAEDLGGIDIDDRNDVVYTVQRGTSNLYVYDWDPTTRTLTLKPGYPKALPNCGAAFGLALDEIHGFLYVADTGNGVVRIYDVATWSEVSNFAPSFSPVGIAIDRNRRIVYTTAPDGTCAGGTPTGNALLSKYDLSTGVETTVDMGHGGMGIAVDEVTGYVYVTGGCSGDDISVWDSDLNFIYSTGNIGNPAGIAIGNVSYNPLNLLKNDVLAGYGVSVGQEFTYQITFANNGSSPITGVKIIDTLPPELDFVSETLDGTPNTGVYDSATHTVTWDIGTIPAGYTGKIALVVRVNQKAAGKDVIYNYCTIKSDQTPPTTVIGQDPDNPSDEPGTYIIANQPPETEIKTADIDPSKGTATFTWTGTDDTTSTKDLLYCYRLVRPSATGPSYGKWSAWSSGKTKTYTNLPAGNYKFEVRAKDKDSAIDPSPAAWEFTIGASAIGKVRIVPLYPQDSSEPSEIMEHGILYRYFKLVDDSGGPIPGAEVHYLDPSDLQVSITDENGVFFVTAKADDIGPAETEKTVQLIQRIVLGGQELACDLSEATFPIKIRKLWYHRDLCTVNSFEVGLDLGPQLRGFGFTLTAASVGVKGGTSIAHTLSYENKPDGDTLTLQMRIGAEIGLEFTLGAKFRESGLLAGLSGESTAGPYDWLSFKIPNPLGANRDISENLIAAYFWEKLYAEGLVYFPLIGPLMRCITEFVYRSALDPYLDEVGAGFQVHGELEGGLKFGFKGTHTRLSFADVGMEGLIAHETCESKKDGKTRFSELYEFGAHVDLGLAFEFTRAWARRVDAKKVFGFDTFIQKYWEGKWSTRLNILRSGEETTAELVLGRESAIGAFSLPSFSGVVPNGSQLLSLRVAVPFDWLSLADSVSNEVEITISRSYTEEELEKLTDRAVSEGRNLTYTTTATDSFVFKMGLDLGLGFIGIGGHVGAELLEVDRRTYPVRVIHTIPEDPYLVLVEQFNPQDVPLSIWNNPLLSSMALSELMSNLAKNAWNMFSKALGYVKKKVEVVVNKTVEIGQKTWKGVKDGFHVVVEGGKDLANGAIVRVQQLGTKVKGFLRKLRPFSTQIASATTPLSETTETTWTPMTDGLIIEIADAEGNTINEFDDYVDISLAYSDAQLEEAGIPDRAEKYLRIFWWDPTETKWVPIPSTCNTSENYVSGKILNAGLYVVGLSNTPPQGEIISPRGGETITGGTCTIAWTTSDDQPVEDSLVDILFASADSPETWLPIATDIPNIGSYQWDVTGLRNGEYMVKVVITDPFNASTELIRGPFIIATVPAKTGIIVAPNPVGNTGAIFYYALPAGTSAATLMIFNVSGRPVFETPLDVGSRRFPGAGMWNPVDKDGIPLANGPYIYVLIANGKVIGQGKMVIQR